MYVIINNSYNYSYFWSFVDSGSILWGFSEQKTTYGWSTESDSQQRNAGQGDLHPAKQAQLSCSKGFGWISC